MIALQPDAPQVSADVAAPPGMLRVSGSPCDVVRPTTWHLALRMLDAPEAVLQGAAPAGCRRYAPCCWRHSAVLVASQRTAPALSEPL